MYEFEEKKQNVYVCSQKFSSPLKEGGKISLNGDVSIRIALLGFVFLLHV